MIIQNSKLYPMKKALPILLSMIFFITIVDVLQAQDPVFSQFYTSPLQTNPALTGVYDGKFRVHLNYKQQWNSILDTRPFKTMAFGYDMRHPVGRDDFFSWGVTALRDEAGEGNFTKNIGGLNLSYMKALGGGGYRRADQYLIGGFQVAYGQFSLDPDRLWFSSQFNTGTEVIDPSLDPNVNGMINDSSDPYLDMSAGLMWYSVFDKNMSMYFGGALFHANAPKYTFLNADGKEQIDTRWMAQFGGELPLNHQLSVLPGVIVTGQGPSLLSIFGLNFRYTNRDWRELAIRAGAWGHVSKDEIDNFSVPTITFTAILEVERLNIGLSYDVNANKLSEPTNSRGGFELSLIYIHPGSRKEKVNCPKM